MSERAEKRAEKRSGTDRAAILLLSLGEQEAAQVLKHMGARDVQKVGAAMTRNVITADPDETIDECLARMTDRRVRHLPVLKDGRLVGIISIGDLVKHRIASVEAEAAAMQAYISAH